MLDYMDLLIKPHNCGLEGELLPFTSLPALAEHQALDTSVVQGMGSGPKEGTLQTGDQ